MYCKGESHVPDTLDVLLFKSCYIFRKTEYDLNYYELYKPSTKVCGHLTLNQYVRHQNISF